MVCLVGGAEIGVGGDWRVCSSVWSCCTRASKCLNPRVRISMFSSAWACLTCDLARACSKMGMRGSIFRKRARDKESKSDRGEGESLTVKCSGGEMKPQADLTGWIGPLGDSFLM